MRQSSQSESKRTSVFLRGFRLTLSFQAGLIPFGVFYATLATSAGFPWWLTLLFSMLVLGGSSQLVFIDLYSHLGSALQAVLGSNIVNARHLIYSAGVSHEFSQFRRRWRVLLAYLLTDQLYAIAEAERESYEKIPLGVRPWFFFGSGFCTWFFWLISTAAGIVFGQLIPKSWGLEFSIPLMFMPMLFKVCKNKFAYISVSFSVVFVFLFQNLPFGLGILLAILLASLVGFLVENRVRAKK